MKWMSTDFREERKWKVSIAGTMASWCADYVNSSPQERRGKRIKVQLPPIPSNDEDMVDASTPDLTPSGANETENESLPDDDELFAKFGAHPPSGLFSLGFNDVVMKIDRTPAMDELIQALPSYEPILESTSDDAQLIAEPTILPVSKLVTGKLVSVVNGPPRKRSRFEYEQEDEPPSRPLSRSQTTTEHSMPSTPGRRFNRNDLDPEMSDVALFNPENKHVRDRIQAGHAFRPPSEFAMPSTSFFEARASSQWLWEEDQKLRNFVKEYTFNWSLIASCMSMPSRFTSGPERRTPWECFERWVQLEGLPAEMSKTQYFRTYQSRLEAAQRTVSAQQQAIQQQLQQQAQSTGQQLSSQVRRRTTQPIRVERRKNNRYLAIIDGMRKLARKRESAAHKQQECEFDFHRPGPQTFESQDRMSDPRGRLASYDRSRDPRVSE
jgi:chromatin modification-related protein VID21